MFNIGEISKPSVDGKLVEKKFNVSSSQPVLKSQAVDDSVELSEASLKQFREDSKSMSEDRKKQLKSKSTIDSKDENLTSSSKGIDIEV